MTHYEIRVQGWIDPSWSDWLGGLMLCHEENGVTLLTGLLPDQAALYGVISKLRDLGLTLLSVTTGALGGEHDD